MRKGFLHIGTCYHRTVLRQNPGDIQMFDIIQAKAQHVVVGHIGLMKRIHVMRKPDAIEQTPLVVHSPEQITAEQAFGFLISNDLPLAVTKLLAEGR